MMRLVDLKNLKAKVIVEYLPLSVEGTETNDSLKISKLSENSMTLEDPIEVSSVARIFRIGIHFNKLNKWSSYQIQHFTKGEEVDGKTGSLLLQMNEQDQASFKKDLLLCRR